MFIDEIGMLLLFQAFGSEVKFELVVLVLRGMEIIPLLSLGVLFSFLMASSSFYNLKKSV